MSNLIAKILEVEEGFRSAPYLCSEDYVTIGFGTKLHKDKGMDPHRFTLRVDRKIASLLLHEEVCSIETSLTNSHVGGVGGIYHSLNKFPNRKTIVQSMCYQMGVRGVLQFHNMWAAITLEDWAGASEAMLDSKWARQTPARAGRHAEVMRTGILASAYPDRYFL